MEGCGSSGLIAESCRWLASALACWRRSLSMLYLGPVFRASRDYRLGSWSARMLACLVRSAGSSDHEHTDSTTIAPSRAPLFPASALPVLPFRVSLGVGHDRMEGSWPTQAQAPVSTLRRWGRLCVDVHFTQGEGLLTATTPTTCAERGRRIGSSSGKLELTTDNSYDQSLRS